MEQSEFETTHLSELFPEAAQYTDKASGILAVILSREMAEMIVWFKPEQLSTIYWAGNPDKVMQIGPEGTPIISPRSSFASFAQIVHRTSERWSPSELRGVARLKEKIQNTVNKKANEIRLINERLKTAYEELDTFSYTISHDLRTPLTSIKTYTELFLLKNREMDAQSKHLLERVLVAAKKMNFLIDDILELARAGRKEVKVEQINMSVLIREIKTEVVASLKADHVHVEIGDCPDLEGDNTLITQVFTNVISNAVKYCAKSDLAKVSIEGSVDVDEITYAIKDNGIGIDVKYYDRVFELFKRMDNVKDFEGTGVGLAIVKRIVEKQQGRIWFESELNLGTTFYLAFKK